MLGNILGAFENVPPDHQVRAVLFEMSSLYHPDDSVIS